MTNFKRYAGSLQLEINDFDDLLAALKVPRTQWVATACPIDGLNCDARFLNFLDADSNGRIRVEELSRAVTWTSDMLDDREGADKASDELLLRRLSTKADGLKAAAKLVRESQGEKDGDRITLQQIRESQKDLRAAYFNGDGIIAPESVSDARLKEVVNLILTCVVETRNRSDKPGVTKAHLEDVKKRIASAVEHQRRKSEAYPWADAAESRVDVVRAVKDRVSQYFLQCRLVASNPGAVTQFRIADDVLAAAVGDPAALARAASQAPIAQPVADGTLEWGKLYRGVHFEALSKLRGDVFEPVFGKDPRMTETQWTDLVAKADAAAKWGDGVAADAVIFAKLAEFEKVSDAEFGDVGKLCDEDLARKEKLEAVDQLEKLILYQRWLLRIANNFIAMRDLYDPAFTALFEQGKLILSGRLFTFSVKVSDRPTHATIATRGTMFVAYVKVFARDGEETFEVAVPVTSGTAAGVEVGKRGVFVDTAGKEWDAMVVQIVANPVSLWEAILAPYRRIGAFVGGKVEAWASQGDHALEAQLNRGADEAQHAREAAAGHPLSAPTPAPAPAAAPAASGAGGNIAIAVSIAISAISGVLGVILGIFNGKTALQIIGMLFGLFLAVSLPAGVLAWLKLRKRDMAIVLEACGWALNDRMRLGPYLGDLFTRRPARPQGATIERLDSVRETIKRRRAEGLDEVEHTGLRFIHWLLIVAGLLLLGVYNWREPLCDLGVDRHWIPRRVCTFIAPAPAPTASAGTAGHVTH